MSKLHRRSPTCARSEPALVRSIGLPQATALVAGIIVGASIFVQPAEIARQVPSLAGTMAVWLAAGALTFLGAMVAAELSTAFPQSGGVYVFLREGIGKPVAFLWGWAMFWIMHSGIIAASAVILARHLAYFVPLSESGTRAVAVAAILILSAVNYAGVRQAASVQVIVTAIKLAAIALLLALAFMAARGNAFQPSTASGAFGAREFAIAVGACLFTYGGWHMVTYSAEETRDPRRTIPRALAIGTLLVTACYLGINAICLGVLPIERVAASSRPAADAAEALAGIRGGSLVAALVAISSLSVLNGVILAGPRVYLAMARDGLLFSWLARVDPRSRTPLLGIAVQAAWASALAAAISYRGLFTRVIYTEWLFFALMTIGLFRLRRAKDYQPAYRAWGYPAAPAIFTVAALLVAIYQMLDHPAQAATGLLFVLAGLPVYYWWRR